MALLPLQPVFSGANKERRGPDSEREIEKEQTKDSNMDCSEVGEFFQKMVTV